MSTASVSTYSISTTTVPSAAIPKKSISTTTTIPSTKRGAGIFEAEDNNKEEEDLVMEEAKSYAIIVDNQEILPRIVRTLQRHVHITKLLIVSLSNVRS